MGRILERREKQKSMKCKENVKMRGENKAKADSLE